MTTVAVLGGGLAGLYSAYELSKKGFKTLLLEKDEDLGGLASSYSIEGQPIPKTYHHVMYGDMITLGIIKELGFENELYWRKLKVGFYSQKRFYDFSSSTSILKFKPLSYLGRMKFGLLVLKARRKMSWDELNNVSIEDYALSNAGKDAYKLVNYIVQAKFAEPPANISAAWLMSRFGHESKSVSNQFGYLKGGIQKIIDGLATGCAQKGGLVETRTKVTRILIKDEKINSIEYEKEGKTKVVKPDIVITTLPTPTLLEISDELPSDYALSLKNIRYKASICVAFAFRQRISPFYWLNIMDLQRYPFVGVFEHDHLNTNLNWPSLVYVVKYLDVKDSFWMKSDEEIVEEFLTGLSEIFDCSLKESLLWHRVHRADYSTPVFVTNYDKYKPEIKSPVEGLYVGGISRTYPRDRYMGTAFQTGSEAAEAVASDYTRLMQK